MEDEGSSHAPAHRRHRRLTLKRALLVIIGLLVIGGAVTTFLILRGERPPLALPEKVHSKVTFPVYIPRRLPGNFQIAPESLAIAEKDVLVYQAKDSAETIMSFTEQKRPKDLNFTEFYHENMNEGKVLDNTPYPTFTGKTFDNKTNMLSIVTDETWILVTTRAPLTDAQWRAITDSLYKYKR
jgi:hypothetical protein